MTQLKRRGARALWAVVMVVIAIVVIHVTLDRLFDYRLHAALGYGHTYLKMMVFELITRYAGGILVGALGYAVFRKFRRFVPRSVFRPIHYLFSLISCGIGYALCSLDPTLWMTAFHHHLLGQKDPIMHLDDAFYVYTLPVVNEFAARVLFLYICALLLQVLYVALCYVGQRRITKGEDLARATATALRKSVLMGGILFILFALVAFVSRYSGVLGPGNGSFVSGPDFVSARLGIGVFSWIHIAFLLLTAVLLFWLWSKPSHIYEDADGFVRLRHRWLRRPIQAFAAFIASYVATAGVSALITGLYVHPNQNRVELPYIADSIKATRFGMNIEHVKIEPFQGVDTLSKAMLNKDQNAVANVRVNDQDQTKDVYNQLQSFKSYFNFDNVSVDRYQNQEVYVSARQMDQTQLPVPTWINKTLVYTHGYGLAASPVNDVTSNGLPNIIAGNTPQTTQSPIPPLKQPQIYFGTMQGTVIAPSKEPEFDYPSGSEDKTSHYQGGYALPIQGNRLLLAIETKSLRYYTSNQLTAKSEYLFDRDIYQRVADIAPFLKVDNDAFPFIDERTGHIMWMLDAYTESNNIPYADTFMGNRYIRNSVKIVMDAYTGQTTFYVVDPADPLIQTYMSVYPRLFTTKIPSDIRAHFRYPKDLFKSQAQALTRYHMTDPAAFYNQEDLWAVAKQIYQQNQTQPRDPVYQMIRMPGEAKPSFVLSELYTPVNKDNLNGWLVADNGPQKYGELRLYQFPQSHLVFGPMQVENQIDANPSISQQLSLWNQQGSRVVRGDLLLVPIGDAMVYVEPVYLVASRENSLPQLQLVIVDFNEKVYSGPTLADALQNVVNGMTVDTGQGLGPTQNQNQGQGQGTPGNTAPPAQGNQNGQGAAAGGSLADQAKQLLQKYKDDTAKGNFEQAGQDLAQLGTILNELASKGQK